MKICVGHSANAGLHFNHFSTPALQAQQLLTIEHQQVEWVVVLCTFSKPSQKRRCAEFAVEEVCHEFAAGRCAGAQHGGVVAVAVAVDVLAIIAVIGQRSQATRARHSQPGTARLQVFAGQNMALVPPLHRLCRTGIKLVPVGDQQQWRGSAGLPVPGN